MIEACQYILNNILQNAFRQQECLHRLHLNQARIARNATDMAAGDDDMIPRFEIKHLFGGLRGVVEKHVG